MTTDAPPVHRAIRNTAIRALARRRAAADIATALALVSLVFPVCVSAHSGPAYPVVTDQRHGPYVISIWTDPDTTDDGSAGGRFWAVVTSGSSPPAARVRITATPQPVTGRTTTVDVASPGRDGHTYYGAVVMDHEGPYGIDVAITGPAGDATVHLSVDATYDLRPSPLTAALYLLPFVLVGLLWMRMLIRRSRLARAARAASMLDAPAIDTPPVSRR